MDVMNDLETSAVVGKESYFWRAETLKASSRFYGQSVAISERRYRVPLTKLAENVSPLLNLVDRSSIQVTHGVALNQDDQFNCYLVNAFHHSRFVAIVIFFLNSDVWRSVCHSSVPHGHPSNLKLLQFSSCFSLLLPSSFLFLNFLTPPRVL
jgi:hypothetical protein